jgi:hypothetical protein
MLMSDTGNNCQGCGKPQKPGTLYCTSCGLPVAGAASGTAGPDTRTVMAPGNSKPAAGNTVPAGGSPAAGNTVPAGASPEWRPGQDWSPGAGWQQEQQQVPWWLTPAQPGQQDAGQQGFNQGYGAQPTGPQGTGPQGPTSTTSPVPPGGGRPSRLPLIAVTIAAAALLGAGAGAYVLIAHPFSSPASPSARGSSVANVSQSTPANPSAAPSSATGPATPAQSSHVAPTTTPATPPPTQPASRPTSPAASERQAATSLAGLLSQSTSDRTAINDAWTDGTNCGGNYAADQQTFQQAANNRRYLLGQLAGLAGASTLPAQMLSDLTNAWQASIAVDNDYAQWSSDENSGCTTQDPSYEAANTPNSEATNDKDAFASQWDPIAAQYSLPQYSGDQL